jgi:hypothetical protein
MVQKCVHIYVNAKMISVEKIPEMRGEGHRRAEEGVNYGMKYLIHCKKFLNATMYTQPVQQ